MSAELRYVWEENHGGDECQGVTEGADLHWAPPGWTVLENSKSEGQKKKNNKEQRIYISYGDTVESG